MSSRFDAEVAAVEELHRRLTRAFRENINETSREGGVLSGIFEEIDRRVAELRHIHELRHEAGQPRRQ